MRRVLALAFVLGCQTRSGPTCDATADHVERLLTGEDGAREIRKAFASSCARDEWSINVRDCIKATTAMADPQNCRRLMSPAQSKALDDALAAVDKILRGRIPQACNDYEGMVQRVASCAQVPQEIRRDLASKLADHKRDWEMMEDKSPLRDVCSSGIGALRTAFPECFR